MVVKHLCNLSAGVSGSIHNELQLPALPSGQSVQTQPTAASSGPAARNQVTMCCRLLFCNLTIILRGENRNFQLIFF